MKRVLFTVLFLVLSVVVFAQEAEPKLDLVDLIRNMDWINVALVIILSIGGIVGKYALTARTKLKQVSELFAMAYEFTDDKVLDKDERKQLIDQFLLIIGKKQAVEISEKVQEEVKRKRYKHK